MTDHLTDRELDDALASIRADVGPMSDAAFRTGRDQLRAAAPAADSRGERIQVGPLTALHRPAAGARFRPWAAAASVAAVGAAIALGMSLPPMGGEGFSPAEARSACDTMPALGTVQPLPPSGWPTVQPMGWPELEAVMRDRTIPPGRYHYVRTVSYTGSPTVPPRATVLIEEWVPADPSREWLHCRSDAGVSTNGERRAPGGDYEIGRSSEWVQPSREFLAGLPRDPAALHAALEAEALRVGEEGALPMWGLAAEMFAGAPVPADLRVALVRALQLEPGVIRELTARRDAGSTPVATLGVGSGERSRYLVFDARTGEFRGDRVLVSVEGDPDGARSAHTASETVVTTTVVDGLGKRPS